jgi:16S rRNA (guanine527-N7)-methyltransferase
VPGLPLAIARPDAKVALIESTRKKAAFLQSAAQQLELSNVTVLALRAEEAGRGRHRESFDIAVARAVATLDWLAEWCLPLVKPGGAMLAMKGPKVREELEPAKRAIRACGGGEAALHPVDLPGAHEHLIVEIRKSARTRADYPRDPTVAKGKPIK